MENVYQNTLTVRMSARYHSLCERWYLKLNKLVQFVNLFLASAVVGTVLANYPRTAVASGLLIAFMTALDAALGTAQKPRCTGISIDAICTWTSPSTGWTNKQSSRKRVKSSLTSRPSLRSRVYAYRANLETHGHEPSVKLSWLQWIMMVLV